MAKCCVVFSQSPFEDLTAFRIHHVLLLVSILTSNALGQWWVVQSVHPSVCWSALPGMALWAAKVIAFYPVLFPKLTLIQPVWSAYPYHLVFLIWYPYSLVFLGIHMPLLPYMVMQPIVLGMALLWAAMDSSLSQGPLLWHHNDMTVIVSRNLRGRERDTQQRLDNVSGSSGSKEHIYLDRRGHSQTSDVEVQVYTRVLHLHKAVGRKQVQTG